MISWDNVLDTAIDQRALLETFTVSQQNLILNQVALQVPESQFYAYTFDARRYLAAHLATMAIGPAAGEGTASNQTLGDVSVGVTLAVNNPSAKQNLLATVYGREYFEIFKQVAIPVWTD